MRSKYIKLFLAVFLIGIVVFYFASRGDCGRVNLLSIGANTLRIHEVCSLEDQQKGLGDISLADFEKKADGMLFRFDSYKDRTFWMKDMQFPIDIIWIANGAVVKVDSSVPAPLKGETPQTRSSQGMAIDRVLELPAGKGEEYGIRVGTPIP